MTYRTDYHIHTTFSDGREGPEASIKAGIEAGLTEIGFSEHITLVPEKQKWSMDPERLPEYVILIEKLRKQYPGIAVRMGVELDYLPGKEKKLDKIISAYPFDYVIGSVHYMGPETVDLGPEFYLGKDIDHSPIDRAPASDDAIACRTLGLHAKVGAAMGDKHVEFFKTFFVQKNVNSFTSS